MTDIVERLRDPKPPHYGKCIQAADEIERLRKAITAMRESAAMAAETGWISADYDIVGIADADVCMKLCEHVAREIRAIKDGE